MPVVTVTPIATPVVPEVNPAGKGKDQAQTPVVLAPTENLETAVGVADQVGTQSTEGAGGTRGETQAPVTERVGTLEEIKTKLIHELSEQELVILQRDLTKDLSEKEQGDLALKAALRIAGRNRSMTDAGKAEFNGNDLLRRRSLVSTMRNIIEEEKRASAEPINPIRDMSLDELNALKKTLTEGLSQGERETLLGEVAKKSNEQWSKMSISEQAKWGKDIALQLSRVSLINLERIVEERKKALEQAALATEQTSVPAAPTEPAPVSTGEGTPQEQQATVATPAREQPAVVQVPAVEAQAPVVPAQPLIPLEASAAAAPEPVKTLEAVAPAEIESDATIETVDVPGKETAKGRSVKLKINGNETTFLWDQPKDERENFKKGEFLLNTLSSTEGNLQIPKGTRLKTFGMNPIYITGGKDVTLSSEDLKELFRISPQIKLETNDSGDWVNDSDLFSKEDGRVTYIPVGNTTVRELSVKEAIVLLKKALSEPETPPVAIETPAVVEAGAPALDAVIGTSGPIVAAAPVEEQPAAAETVKPFADRAREVLENAVTGREAEDARKQTLQDLDNELQRIKQEQGGTLTEDQQGLQKRIIDARWGIKPSEQAALATEQASVPAASTGTLEPVATPAEQPVAPVEPAVIPAGSTVTPVVAEQPASSGQPAAAEAGTQAPEEVDLATAATEQLDPRVGALSLEDRRRYDEERKKILDEGKDASDEDREAVLAEFDNEFLSGIEERNTKSVKPNI